MNRFITAILSTTIDPSLGKIDKSTMSQQTLMELLIENIVDKEFICISRENPPDISEWIGVTSNDHGEVLEIYWSYMELCGSIEFRWLPTTIETFEFVNYVFSKHCLSGTIDLNDLPQSLKHLILSGNHLEGEVSLTSLPDQMEHLNVSNNRLSGTLDFTKLPSTLKELHLDSNNFEGEADFTNLPKSLEELHLSHNKNLRGVIHVDPGVLYCQVMGSKVEKKLLRFMQKSIT